MRTRIGLLAALAAPVLLSACFRLDSLSPQSVDQVPVTRQEQLFGLSAKVDVLLDEYGRPHVYGANKADIARVTGWLHANDRFVEMDLERRLAGGNVSELVGNLLPDAKGQDERMRGIGLLLSAQQTYANLPSGSAEKAVLDAYAAGVNQKIQEMGTTPNDPEYAVFGYPFTRTPPWTPVDSLLVGRLLAFELGWDGDTEANAEITSQRLQRTFPDGGKTLHDLFFRFKPPVLIPIVNPTVPPPIDFTNPLPDFLRVSHGPLASVQAARRWAQAVKRSPLNLLRGKTPDIGSNNWVVSGKYTASGYPILCNDPHLNLNAPPVWYEMEQDTSRAGGTLTEVGVTLPGVPSIIIGANGHLAWGVTNTGPDVTDLYVEHVTTGSNGQLSAMFNPTAPAGNPAFYPLNRDDEQITFRTTTGGWATETVTYWRIPWRLGGNASIIPGSIVGGTAMSWSWTGMAPTGELATLDQLADAQSASDLMAAVGNWEVPIQNFVYADEKGAIGYIANGFYPIRGNAGDLYTNPPFLPMPGYDGLHEWTGRIPMASVPQEQNPARGWTGSSNQDPWGNTFDADPLNDPYYIGVAFDDGFRGKRIAETLTALATSNGAGTITPQDLMGLQSDHLSGIAQRLVPFLIQSIQQTNNPQAQLLQEWAGHQYPAEDGTSPTSNLDDASATALFNTWLVAVKHRAFDDEETKAGVGPFDAQLDVRTLLLITEHPQEAATWSATEGQSTLWDDAISGVHHTRDEIFQLAMGDGLAFLASPLGFGSSDPHQWQWGKLHRLTLTRISGIPGTYDIPNPLDPNYPNGFFRHGDLLNVDASNISLSPAALSSGHDFTYADGPSMRWIVELVPGDMRIYNSLPGGASSDPKSPHYADQALDYAQNKWHNVWWKEPDVAFHAQAHLVFTP